MRYIKGFVLFLLMITPGSADSKVFLDESFPYRVVCQSTWTETMKTDSLTILQESATGKKIQLQLRRYPIDTGFSFEPMQWSRLNYSVNRELADGVGEIIWGDSSSSKKLGDLRAFELFALYSQEVGTKTIWWAEYCRWTERNNYGYLVVIMGDTLDLQLDLEKSNSTYKMIMDSVDIMELQTTTLFQQHHCTLPAIRSSEATSTAAIDLLGRKWPSHAPLRSALLLHNSKKMMLLPEMAVP